MCQVLFWIPENNSKRNRQKSVPSISLHSNSGKRKGQELKYIVYQILTSAIEKLKLGRKTGKIWAMGFSNSNGMIREGLMEKVIKTYSLWRRNKPQMQSSVSKYNVPSIVFLKILDQFHWISLSIFLPSFFPCSLPPSLPPFNLFPNIF